MIARASMGSCLQRLAVLSGLVLAPACGRLDKTPAVALDIRIPAPPEVAPAGPDAALVYEVHVVARNGPMPALRRVEVLTGDAQGRLLLSLGGNALRAVVRGEGDTTDFLGLERGGRIICFLWVAVDGERPPSSLRHRLVFASPSRSGDSLVEVMAPVPVRRGAPTLGPPLRGSRWLAGDPPTNNGTNRRFIMPTLTIANRFAIDFTRLDARGRAHRGDSLDNGSYYGYGSDVIAVAAGRVVSVRNDAPENRATRRPSAPAITDSTASGNHVILDIGKGHYVLYGHLKPGSVRVRPGDDVRRGEVLGLVGNSGSSTRPHLHFHVMSAPRTINAEGLPYAFDSYAVIGHCGNRDCTENAVPALQHGRLPGVDELLSFP